MMLDRYAIERMATERQAEWLREADEQAEAPWASVALLSLARWVAPRPGRHSTTRGTHRAKGRQTVGALQR